MNLKSSKEMLSSHEQEQQKANSFFKVKKTYLKGNKKIAGNGVYSAFQV
jgi:hypothetical protein